MGTHLQHPIVPQKTLGWATRPLNFLRPHSQRSHPFEVVRPLSKTELCLLSVRLVISPRTTPIKIDQFGLKARRELIPVEMPPLWNGYGEPCSTSKVRPLFDWDNSYGALLFI